MGSAQAQLFESAHTHPRKNHTLNIRKIVIIYQQKTFFYIFNIAIINYSDVRLVLHSKS